MSFPMTASTLSWGEEIRLPKSNALATTPHYIGGRYPCRSIAYVPRMILQEFSKGQNFRVLDPFMGSGTTAIEASRYATSVHGLEIDPYARLIADVSTTKYSRKELADLEKLASKAISIAGAIKPDKSLYPKLNNIEYWFDEKNFYQLLKLKTAIYSLATNERYRNFLLTAFGDIIRASSLAERQSLKPYISKKFKKTPKNALEEFAKIAPRYLLAVSENQRNISDGITWEGEDATKFSTSTAMDVAITSPPYINAMDYTRCIKLESAWIGTLNDGSLKEIRSGQVGESARRKVSKFDSSIQQVCGASLEPILDVDPIRFHTAMSYFWDMKLNLISVRDSLSAGGRYFVIVGNSRIRGVDVDTHALLANLAEEVGFEWKQYFRYRIRDHRTSIPRGDQGGKIEMEHVLGLQKK